MHGVRLTSARFGGDPSDEVSYVPALEGTGTADLRHCSSAAAKALCSASLARSKSPSRRIRVANTRVGAVDLVHLFAQLLGPGRN